MSGGAKKRPTRYGDAPGETPEALTLALRAHRKGEFGVAIEHYREALEQDAESVDAWMNLGALCALGGRAREAEGAFERARECAPTDARVHRDAGIGLLAVGRGEQGRAALERAVALDGALQGARLSLVRVCMELGDRGEALAQARTAVAGAPDDASSHLELHRVLFDDQSPGACIAAAQRAVELDPEYALARYFLAGALMLDGRVDAAESALGPEGLIEPGLVDALRYAIAQRGAGARCFASTRETLLFALGEAPRTGDVLEFGVRHGVTTRVLAGHADTTVHGFDTFTGLPEGWQGRLAGAFSTAGELPEVPGNVRLHVGLFEDTLPGFVREMRSPPRLIHVDSDLYASARTVLTELAPWVIPGCVIAFDELIGNASWREDEHRALIEASARFGWAYDVIAVSWITGQGVVRIREVASRS